LPQNGSANSILSEKMEFALPKLHIFWRFVKPFGAYGVAKKVIDCNGSGWYGNCFRTSNQEKSKKKLSQSHVKH